MSPSSTLALTLLLGIVAGLLVVVLALILVEGPEGKFKRKRYEAGNPPSGEAKTQLPYQYYGYLLLYLTVEPLLAFLYLYPGVPREQALPSFLVLLSAFLFLAPLVAWGVKAADELERWRA